MDSGCASLYRFLEAMHYQELHPHGPDPSVGLYPFVTISRQAGAGGHSLAKVLLEAMAREPGAVFHGWQLIDQQLCRALMDDPTLRVSFQDLLTEAYHSRVEELLFETLLGRTPQDAVARRTFQAIRTLATVGKVVLIGRAGACVTRGLPGGIHVRLVAPESIRARRMQDLLGVGDAEARAAMRRQDDDRARLVWNFFRRDINDPLLYDVVWNTATVPRAAMAAAILELLRERARRQPAPRRPEESPARSVVLV